MSFVSDFATKEFLSPRYGVRTERSARTGRDVLLLDHPAVLARFIAFVKARVAAWDGEVYLRGQTEEFPGMVPALFRMDEVHHCAATEAYTTMLDMVPRHLVYRRFDRDNIGSVLQHYGIRTPWLDVVDNIWTALWFATNEHVQGVDDQAFYRRSTRPFGWIFLIMTATPDQRRLRVVDLRKQHSSEIVRIQVQHGLSLASQDDYDIITTRDYGDFVAACVRIPNTRRFRPAGSLGNASFFFPAEPLDPSYRILLESNVNAVVESAERDHHLHACALGRVVRYRYRAPRDLPANA